MRRVRQVGLRLCLFAGVLSLAACASSVPPNRMADYVGAQPTESAPPPLPDTSLPAGLVLIPDTTAPGAGPMLPDEALNRLAERLKHEINQAIPVRIEKILPAEGLKPGGDVTQFVELGKAQGLDYIVVAVASTVEQQYPIYVFLGWHSHQQPGFRLDNWSLLEVALVEVKTGRTVIRAEGRGMATLDSPTAPGINQWYPVIWKRPAYPDGRWWFPPTFEGAPNTLRVIAMDDAAQRLFLNLRVEWNAMRQAEYRAIRS
jgi:hypothetical protein